MIDLLKPKKQVAIEGEFKPGELVDVYHIGTGWCIGDGRIVRLEPNSDYAEWNKRTKKYEWKKEPRWIYTMTSPAHDGVCWSYAVRRDHVRKTITN